MMFKNSSQDGFRHKLKRILQKITSQYKMAASYGHMPKSFRAYWNWLNANLEMVLQTSKIKAKPLKITFEPTNICQLHCPLCPTGLRLQDRKGGYADISMFKKLIGEIGEYLFFIDFFNWGEPFLHPRIEELIKIAKNKNIITFVSTNFSIPMSKERIEAIVRSGLDQIIVSLDGASQKTYVNYRRGGNFKTVIRNIQETIQAKKNWAQQNLS